MDSNGIPRPDYSSVIEQKAREYADNYFEPNTNEYNRAINAFIAGASFMTEEIERIINKYGVDNLDAGDILGFIQELKK